MEAATTFRGGVNIDELTTDSISVGAGGGTAGNFTIDDLESTTINADTINADTINS